MLCHVVSQRSRAETLELINADSLSIQQLRQLQMHMTRLIAVLLSCESFATQVSVACVTVLLVITERVRGKHVPSRELFLTLKVPLQFDFFATTTNSISARKN